MNFTRRDFVRKLARHGGEAAGATALVGWQDALAESLPDSFEPPAPFSVSNRGLKGRSVIVIGAGLAGLVATLELNRAGCDCALYEATERIGGRIFTLRSGDRVRDAVHEQRVGWPEAEHLRFEAGASAISHAHGAILSYCRQLYVPLAPFISDSRAALAHDEHVNGGKPVRLGQVTAALRGRVAELAALVPSGDDRVRIFEMLRTFGALGADGRYTSSIRGGYAVAPGLSGERGWPLETLSLQELARSPLWQTAATFSELAFHSSPMLEVVGGMDKLPAAFVPHLQSVRCATPCIRLERLPGGRGRATFRRPDGQTFTQEADYILITAPPPAARVISHDFADRWRKPLAEAQFSPTVKIGFHADHRFWEDEGIYGGYSWTTQDIAQVGYPSHGLHANGGIVHAGYIRGGEVGDRLSNMEPTSRHRRVLRQMSRLHETFARYAGAAVSVAWRDMPYQRGGWLEGEPGERRQLVEALSEPDWPYVLAGDYLSELSGWQEGAVLSAQAAVICIADHAARS